MPWKGTKDAYRIWLSEIILQQTRVEQGLPYYEKFLRQYPTVRDLALAPEDEVLKCWEGLGYYSRARNLHATAKQVALSLGGDFPDTYEGLRGLKGVGDYTAAAIASFAFDLPHAVLDGNVYRVLSRVLGIDTPIDAPKAKKIFAGLAQSLLDPERPAAYNQAMMDFGATWCTPQNPACRTCPFAEKCVAYQQGIVSELPIKAKKMQKKGRFFLYWVPISEQGQTLVRKRTGNDIWRELYEFPLMEVTALPQTTAEAVALLTEKFGVLPTDTNGAARLSKTYIQLLTHQKVHAVFCEMPLKGVFFEKKGKKEPLVEDIWEKFSILDKKFAFPRIIAVYLRDRNQSDQLTLDF